MRFSCPVEGCDKAYPNPTPTPTPTPTPDLEDGLAAGRLEGDVEEQPQCAHLSGGRGGVRG